MEANQIRGRLKIAGTNGNKIAQSLGVSRQLVYQVINGDISSPRIRSAIAQAIGISEDELWPRKIRNRKQRRKSCVKRGTLKKICGAVNISATRISNILSGNVPCCGRLAGRLAAVTGIPAAAWLLAAPEELRRQLAEKYPKEQKS